MTNDHLWGCRSAPTGRQKKRLRRQLRRGPFIVLYLLGLTARVPQGNYSAPMRCTIESAPRVKIELNVYERPACALGAASYTYSIPSNGIFFTTQITRLYIDSKLKTKIIIGKPKRTISQGKNKLIND